MTTGNTVESADSPYGTTDPLDPGTTLQSGTDSGVVGANSNGVRQWMLGAWWGGNYPGCVHFYQDRLIWGGPTSFPDRLDMSNTSLYEVMSPTSLLDGTVTASMAVAVSLNSNTVNDIQWFQGDQNGLIVGTAGGIWVVTSAALSEAIGPTSIHASLSSEFGSIKVQPMHDGLTTVFLQQGGKKMREIKYDIMISGFRGPDITPLATHATVSGFKSLCIQRTPEEILWLVRNDGKLVSVTYDPDQNEVAFAVHEVGGADVKVLSATVIPSPDGTRDEVWIAVSRTVNGATVVYVERMSKLWEVGDAVLDTVDGVQFYRYVPDNTVYLDSSQRAQNDTAFTTVSGLTWLIGQTVAVLADGSVQPNQVVNASGQITLSSPAKDVVVGLPYTSIGRTLTVEAGGADGPAQGKVKRIERVIFRVYETSGFQVTVPGSGAITDVFLRQTNDLMDQPVPLRTDDIVQSWEGGYDRLGQVEWQQSLPEPLNISGLVLQLETEDGG